MTAQPSEQPDGVIVRDDVHKIGIWLPAWAYHELRRKWRAAAPDPVASPPAPLDVERLARALAERHNLPTVNHSRSASMHGFTPLEEARSIVAADTRLAGTTTEKPFRTYRQSEDRRRWAREWMRQKRAAAR